MGWGLAQGGHLVVDSKPGHFLKPMDIGYLVCIKTCLEIPVNWYFKVL